jgi:glycosyltransferase involved in cell wall biosynthesis
MLKEALRAYKNKISKKLTGVVHISARGKKKGYVLLSYLTSPFTMSPGRGHTDPHASYWECQEIARLISERGYAVNVIDWQNTTFIPKKKYAAVIDIQKSLERLSPFLHPSCKKVMHVVSAYGPFQNQAENTRLTELKNRRGIELIARRVEAETNNPAFADYMEGFGNARIHSTYSKFNKSIFPIHESVSMTFDFPADKNFAQAKRNFMWFGGGGAIHKGLDLVLEAFASTPDLELHIVGPVSVEKDFMEAYKKELSLPNIHLHGRPKFNTEGVMMIGDRPFVDLANECGALIYLSCSEGTSGAVVQAMHAGLYPMITPETGIDEKAPSTIIQSPSVISITAAIRSFASLSENEVASKTKTAWLFARSFYSKEEFTRTYSEFLDTILKI